jgi:hypothetical protein
MKHQVVHALQKYVLNPPIKLLFAFGIAPPGYALLETTGRKTGKARRTPVGDGWIGYQFWLVAEHGTKAGYVRNIAANPRGLSGLTLVRGMCFATGMDGVDSHGSLAVFVPTDSGLVVCSDKREWNPVRGASDTETKIYVLNQKAALIITGSIAILDSAAMRPLFSVKDLAIEHLKDETPPGFVDRIRSLPKAMDDAYLGFLQGGGKKLEQSPGATDDIIYSITVWYASEARVNVSRIQLHSSSDAGHGGVTYQDVTEELGRSLYIEGQTDFILAAIRKSDSRFATFRADPEIKAVLISTDPATVSAALAVRFGRKIIRATNEFHHLVSADTPNMVSADSDCSLMNPSRGFEWLK